jgi:chromosome segregation ATPase
MASSRRKRKRAAASQTGNVAELEKALAELRSKLETAEEARTAAVSQGTEGLLEENEALEARLTAMVLEIGLLRFVVERVPQLERELRAKDLRIAEAEAETNRLRAALDSGRPTARAAAAASQAARLFGTGR